MKVAADLVLRSQSTGDVAMIEVKNRRDLTSALATMLRRNLIIHGQYRRVPYFVLLSQDSGYIWTPDEEPWIESPPKVSFPLHSVVAHYYPDFDPAIRLRESELMLIIERWIDDLIHGDIPNVPDPDNAMERSGLLSALREQSGSVEVLG
jgi:hypothetical protein